MVLYFTFESKMFIQKITKDTTKNVVWCGWYPITKMKHIVEDKHKHRTYNCINYAYKNKFPESEIKKKCT